MRSYKNDFKLLKVYYGMAHVGSFAGNKRNYCYLMWAILGKFCFCKIKTYH